MYKMTIITFMLKFHSFYPTKKRTYLRITDVQVSNLSCKTDCTRSSIRGMLIWLPATRSEMFGSKFGFMDRVLPPCTNMNCANVTSRCRSN